ncbi:hypothetical protein GCK72_002786 [Caenorhabditis remanei]|uniref:Tr-type G domain-containing protein n=1 Tax=Caenorhabditis remanei TaxID=31234 RepID=A0A6A5HXY2_CAERE|nr:hypothetical protein GCK72_002786 [Caenorhabditis remanei]KAF1770962.1 hypothetical protein GCK72_002786 [Caenorhabditis remanei]
MSRHRNIRRMIIEHEREDYYDDYEDYEDEEETENQYTYHNRKPTAVPLGRKAPFVQQNQKHAKKHNNGQCAPLNEPKKTEQVKDVLRESATPAMSKKSSEMDLTEYRRNQLLNIARAPFVPRRTAKPRLVRKDLINLIVVGHVDAGKSTLMGHLLHDLDVVDTRTIDKYKRDAARSGKASFAYAWVLDETEEERERGVTMDIGRTSFETENRRIVLLDAPGHKDFISNMITGTSQADAAILVVNATTGEFETGFENGGQTKEHALLLRSLGVTQLVVAISKLDTVEWSYDRYEEIRNSLSVFLTRHAGFSKPIFVPVSGFTGENLVKRIDLSWYDGPCLLELMNSFVAPKLSFGGPLRIGISDVHKVSENQVVVSGKVESGEVEKDDKVYIMPSVTPATIKECAGNIGAAQYVTGDFIMFTLQGTFEPESVQVGSVVVKSGPDTLIPGRKFQVRLVVFEIATPIIKGAKSELYAHSLCIPCTFTKLIHTIDKSNGEVLKEKPRFISRGMSAVVEIETDHDVAIEAFTSCRALGRVTFRSGGNTIAAGIVEKTITPQ